MRVFTFRKNSLPVQARSELALSGNSSGDDPGVLVGTWQTLFFQILFWIFVRGSAGLYKIFINSVFSQSHFASASDQHVHLPAYQPLASLCDCQALTNLIVFQSQTSLLTSPCLWLVCSFVNSSHCPVCLNASCSSLACLCASSSSYIFLYASSASPTCLYASTFSPAYLPASLSQSAPVSASVMAAANSCMELSAPQTSFSAKNNFHVFLRSMNNSFDRLTSSAKWGP